MQPNESTTSTVLLNGEQPKQMLTALAQKAENLRWRLKEVNEAGDGKAFEKLTKELNQTNKQMKQLAKEAFDVKKVLDNLSGASMPDLTKAKKELDKQLNSPSVVRNSKEWKELQAQLRAVKTEMSSISNESKVTESAFSRLANFTNKTWQMFAAGAAALVGVVLGLKSAAMEAARMSDVYGMVRKYTGESAEGVAGLNEELKKMDSRTARDELNRLLGEAGKLGVKGKEDLLQFAKAADIIQVSLGEDLGADAVKNIGKLTYMFGVQDKMGMEKSLLAVGSAINQVGQNSTASEAYLLEFTNRLSGMGVAANMTIPQIIGFASVLDQNAQQVEMSSTAMNKFIATLATKSESVAKAIGLPAAKLKKAVGEDMNEALMMVFKQLNKKGGLVDLAPLFADLGAEGARAASVITILASKYKDLGTEQSLALKSFNEGTSVVKEFNIQNNTMQAKVDKSKKAFLDASETLGKSLSPAFLHSTNAAVYMVKALSQFPEWFKENKGLLTTLVVAIGTYAAILGVCKLESLALIAVEKTKILVQRISTAATLAQVAITGYLTGATRAANLATKEFFVTLGLNPFVALGAAIVLVTVGLYKLGTAKTAAEKAYKDYNAQVEMEITKSDQLFNALKKTTKGSDERKQLIDKINTVYGDYLGNLLSEKSNLDDINTAQEKVNRSLREKIGLQVKDSSKADIITKAMPEQVDTLEKLTNSISATEGDAVAEIITRRIQDILQKGGYTDKSITTAQNYLKNKLGKNFTAGMEFYPAMLAKSIKSMNDDLSDVDKKFDRIIGKTTAPAGGGNKGPKEGDISADGLQVFKNGKWVNINHGGGGGDLKTIQQTKLDAVDKWLAKEQIKLKKRHESNLDSEEVYAKGIIDLTENALVKKRDIYKKSDKEYLDYQNQIEDIKLKRQDSAEKLSFEAMKALNDKRLNAIVLYDNAQREEIENDFETGVIDQDEHDNKILALDKVLAESRLYVAQEHSRDIAAFQFKSDEERLAAVTAVNKEIEAADKDLTEAQKKILRKSAADKKKIEDEIRDIEKKYGIGTYKDKRKEYEKDLADLKAAHLKELAEIIKHGGSTKAAIARYESDVSKIKLSKAAHTAEGIAQIANQLGDLTNKLQETAELKVDNKYAAELKAAQGNADATTAIEAKKEEEKKQIKKKYADIDFAITVAKIITTTASAIMKDLEEFPGPVGAALAIATGATGLVELGVANEQRNAVQQLWTGGFTEPGDKFKPVGIVHAGEFVGNQDSVRHTPVKKVYDLVNYAQKTNTVARITNEDIARVVGFRKGFSDGGYTSAMQVAGSVGGSGISKEELAWAIQMAMEGNNAVNSALLAELQKGIVAKYKISGSDGVVEGIKKYTKMIENS